ncbi:MAG: hypothetical protein P9X24_11260 [Candidatus Hatepunaea meridiana]|nr:hypothetical protein [Candidatus Hatepunaea meridiana]
MVTSKIKHTELQMGDAFQKLLSSSEGLPGIGTFGGVYREVNCQQGRPDFIALRTKEDSPVELLPHSIGYVGSSILSVLKPNAPRTLEYLLSHSEYSSKSLKKHLQQLLVSDHIIQTSTGSYILGTRVKIRDYEIWAFELKLNNPKRAVFQAQQSRVYAEHSIIVIPPGQEKNYSRFNETIKRWGIGLSTFDPISGIFSIVKKTLKSPALSRQHQIYMIAQLGNSV